jgi:hypothetical protein
VIQKLEVFSGCCFFVVVVFSTHKFSPYDSIFPHEILISQLKTELSGKESDFHVSLKFFP